MESSNLLDTNLSHATNTIASQSNIREANSAETDIHQDDIIMTETYPPSECKMNLAFLCNPNVEDSNMRGHHVSQLFSSELDDIEKHTLDSGCDSKCTVTTLFA